MLVFFKTEIKYSFHRLTRDGFIHHIHQNMFENTFISEPKREGMHVMFVALDDM